MKYTDEQLALHDQIALLKLRLSTPSLGVDDNNSTIDVLDTLLIIIIAIGLVLNTMFLL